ncbi:hypothetical protein [Isobaculum melis]|uniref:Uncharacterized protein n=1 Tax=Isobaculum melis TaxID=142588 RepID=A0A1H9THB2_9LACT|nr:hypothetical protein [Isobaculum melis]SER96541.1 hypothetical protein SAMN04488559_11371 [Isobaculum melis]
MTESKTSEAQKEANRRYRQKNKDKLKVGSYKRTAHLFINTHATTDDLAELEQLIEQRKKTLEN